MNTTNATEIDQPTVDRHATIDQARCGYTTRPDSSRKDDADRSRCTSQDCLAVRQPGCRYSLHPRIQHVIRRTVSPKSWIDDSVLRAVSVCRGALLRWSTHSSESSLASLIHFGPNWDKYLLDYILIGACCFVRYLWLVIPDRGTHSGRIAAKRLCAAEDLISPADPLRRVSSHRSFSSDSTGKPLTIMFMVRIKCSFISSQARAFFRASAASLIARCSTSTSLLRESAGTDRRR